jgi:hypothetical protein
MSQGARRRKSDTVDVLIEFRASDGRRDVEVVAVPGA